MNNNRPKANLAILILLLMPHAGVVAQQAYRTGGINLFPARAFVRSFIADGTAHRFGVEKAFERNEVLGSIGGVLPVAELHVLAVPVQLSLGASAHMTLDPREQIAVISTEYYVDFFMIDMLWSERLFTRVGMGHTSHHLGDNGAAALQNGTVLDYSRDYVQAVGGYDDGIVRLYAGANYGYGFVIGTALHKPWLLTAGGEATLVRFSDELSAVAAVDIKFRQESGFGTTQRFRAGMQFERGGRILRLVLTWKTGLDDRGQFYQRRQSSLSAGLFVDL